MPSANLRRATNPSVVLAALPYVAAVAAAGWIFRSIPDGKLLGNIGDARWTISFHEHWYDVWRGRTSIRDLAQYYPHHGLLGSTDPLLAQGQVYSAARAVGFGLIDAWVIAQFATYLFGLVGLAALARRFLVTWWAQVGFVLASGIAYPVAIQGGHVQLLAIFWPAWVVLAASNLRRGRWPRASWLVVCLLPPVLALSSWYVFVLSALTAAVFGVIWATLQTRARIVEELRLAASRVRSALRRPFVLVTLALGAAGWGLAAWVYLAGAGALPQPTWNDTVSFLPRWSDLVNASGLGGGAWAAAYREWFPTAATVGMERQEGFVPVLLVALLLAILFLLRRAIHGEGEEPARRETSWLLAAAGTCVVVPVLLVTSDDGRSLFEPLWLFVPAMNSIRAPFRVQGIVYALATLVVVRSVERWATRPTTPSGAAAKVPVRLGLAALLLLALLVETNRKPYAFWTADDLLSSDLRELIPDIRDRCDALVLVDEDPTDPGWVLPIDAVTLSVLAEVPTPQGYGRADPVGFPGNAAAPEQLVDWMRSQGFSGRACAVSSSGVEVLA